MFSQEEYDNGDAIALSWHVDDVKSLDSSLTTEQAKEVLKAFERHHEGSMESMWQDLQLHIDMLKEDLERKK